MLKINVNEPEQLTFEVQIGGVQTDQISGYLRININEIEYGFPAKLGEESIVVDVPPLNKVIGNKIKEGEEGLIRLEIVADGHSIVPWSDQVQFSNPLIVEAKIKGSDSKSAPSIVPIVTQSKVKRTITEKENKTETESSNPTTDQVLSSFVNKLEKLLELKEEKSKSLTKSSEPLSESKKVKSVSESESLEGLLDKAIDGFKLTEETKSNKVSKKKNLAEFKKNLSREDIIKYIAKKGTKNPVIQEIIYEQAVKMSEKNEPIYILKSVMDIMKK